jgi:hypothetical protein
MPTILSDLHKEITVLRSNRTVIANTNFLSLFYTGSDVQKSLFLILYPLFLALSSIFVN